jgi:hypothetical protein
MNVKLIISSIYDEIYDWILDENKANLSLGEQTQIYLAPSTAGGSKTKLKKQSQFVSALAENEKGR